MTDGSKVGLEEGLLEGSAGGLNVGFIVGPNDSIVEGLYDGT